MRKTACLLPFLLLAALGACSSDTSLGEAEGEVEVRPSSIDFGQVFLGHHGSEELLLRNLGRAPKRITLTLPPPFSAPAEVVELPGGETRAVELRFAPTEPGEAIATAELSTGHSVELRGEGSPVPSCPPSDDCTSVRFDPEVGCVEEKFADGTTCGDACFDGSCSDGQCVGTARSCDDGNACTLDACDPATGCVHYDDASSCPDDGGDPCRSPICDPEEGCGFVEAPDGTLCGESNCTTSRVCVAGSCTTRTTPDGGPCGKSSPCQEEGTCVEGVCVQDPPHPLEPSWSHAAAPGSTLHFDGVTDGQGHLYWAECSFVSCDLVSVTARGFSRYRQPLFVADVGRAPTGSLALWGDLLVSTLAPGRVEAFRSSDGERVWSTSLDAALLGSDPDAAAATEPPDWPSWTDEGAPPVVTEEVVILPVEGFEERPDGGITAFGGWVVALARETGELRWVWEGPGTFEGFVGDEGGSVVFAHRPHDATPSEGGALISLGTSGEERWRRPTPFQAPLATLGGRLFQATGELRTMKEGHRREQLPLLVPTYPRRSPLLSGRSLTAFGIPMEECDAGSCPVWVPHLFRFDLDSGEELWRKSLPSGQTSEPVLTRELSVIFAYPPADGRGPATLAEIAPDSSTVFSCLLPQGGSFDGPASLYNGQWVTVDRANRAVVGFGLEERTPPRGWVTRGGSNGRTGRPQ